MSPIRVALIEDQKRTRDGLAFLIGGNPDLSICGAFESMEQALPPIFEDPPDVILADIGLPAMSGIEGVRRIHERLPALPILMLTVHSSDDSIFAAICAGACGYLLKETEPERLVHNIREVHAGGAPMSPEVARRVVLMMRGERSGTSDSYPLSGRQWQVLNLLAEGNSYKSCAAKMDISIDTIRFHIRNIYEKLHVNSRAEAIAKVFKLGNADPNSR